MTSLLIGGLGRVFNIENGLVHTAYTLSVRPDTVIRGYWAGATARYTHPAMYLLIAFAVFSVFGRVFGSFTGGGDVERIAAVAFIPLVAGASRLFLYRSGFNYAEHVILVMYTLGHVAVFLAAVLMVFPLLERSATWILSGVGLVGGIVYTAWVYARVFRRGTVLDPIAGIAALFAGAAAWGLILLAFIRLIRR